MQRKCTDGKDENKLHSHHGIETLGRCEHFRLFKSATLMVIRHCEYDQRTYENGFSLRTVFTPNCRVLPRRGDVLVPGSVIPPITEC
jgi:hypothetical protein